MNIRITCVIPLESILLESQFKGKEISEVLFQIERVLKEDERMKILQICVDSEDIL